MTLDSILQNVERERRKRHFLELVVEGLHSKNDKLRMQSGVLFLEKMDFYDDSTKNEVVEYMKTVDTTYTFVIQIDGSIINSSQTLPGFERRIKTKLYSYCERMLETNKEFEENKKNQPLEEQDEEDEKEEEGLIVIKGLPPNYERKYDPEVLERSIKELMRHKLSHRGDEKVDVEYNLKKVFEYMNHYAYCEPINFIKSFQFFLRNSDTIEDFWVISPFFNRLKEFVGIINHPKIEYVKDKEFEFITKFLESKYTKDSNGTMFDETKLEGQLISLLSKNPPKAERLIAVLCQGEANDIEEIEKCSRIDIPGFDLVKVRGKGVWGTVFDAIQTNYRVLIKTQNNDIDITSKGNKKIIDKYGDGDAKKAIDAVFREEGKNAAFLSDRFNPKLKLGDLGYIPTPQFLGYREYKQGKDDRIALVYSDIQGYSLDYIFERLGKLMPNEFLDIMPDLAMAIKYFHDNGFAHNDLKPDNIFFNINLNQIQIIDLAFAMDNNYEGSIIGKRSYTSPRRFLGRHDSAIEGDVFSFGSICYEAITGKTPIEFPEGCDKDEIERQYATKERKIIDLREMNLKEIKAMAHAHVKDVVMKCLEIDPSKSYHSMGEVIHEFNHSSLKKDRMGVVKKRRFDRTMDFEFYNRISQSYLS